VTLTSAVMRMDQCTEVTSLCLCFRELDDRVKQSEDSQNGDEINKSKSKHVRHASKYTSISVFDDVMSFPVLLLQDKYLMDMDELFSKVDEKRKGGRDPLKHLALVCMAV